MLVVFLLIPLVIYSDYRAGHKKCKHNSELFLASIPLLVLFNLTQFFYALSMLLLLVAYGIGLKIVAHKYQWLKFNIELMKSYSIGSVGCGTFAYGLYKLVAYLLSSIKSIDFSVLTSLDKWSTSADAVFTALNHWPYIAYGIVIVVILLATLFDRLPERQNKDEFSIFLVLFIIPASLVLPWFSNHYWWFLLITFIFLPLVVFFVYGYKEENKYEAINIAKLFSFVYFGLSHLNVLFYWLFF